MTRVLVVDDEPQIRKALKVNLEARSYDVILAATGEEALVLAADTHPDVVLLDLGLPGIDGMGVIEGIRGWSEMPIIVLSVRGEESDKVAALDAGADDYVSKPFGMGELLARMRAALRRRRDDPDDPVIATAAFRIDLSATRVTRIDAGSEQEIRLTPIEWGLLEQLVRHPGRLVSQRHLLHEVWGPQYDSETNYLRVHMANLRRKLEPEPSKPRYFVTEPGMGYRFEQDGSGHDTDRPAHRSLGLALSRRSPWSDHRCRNARLRRGLLRAGRAAGPSLEQRSRRIGRQLLASDTGS